MILNGHEYVAIAARRKGAGFVKEGSCFTEIADSQGLARVADALSQPAAIGRLGQACEQWIYTACPCFGLDTSEQQASGFRYGYSVYRPSTAVTCCSPPAGRWRACSDRVLDRTRFQLDIPAVRAIFGLKTRPHRGRASGPPAQEAVIEKPQYGLAWFRISFGRLQIASIVAGARSPRPGRKPAHWTRVDRDYENLRIGMQALLGDLGISASATAA